MDYDKRANNGTLPGEAFFVRSAFDPSCMRHLGPWTMPPPLET